MFFLSQLVSVANSFLIKGGTQCCLPLLSAGIFFWFKLVQVLSVLSEPLCVHVCISPVESTKEGLVVIHQLSRFSDLSASSSASIPKPSRRGVDASFPFRAEHFKVYNSLYAA